MLIWNSNIRLTPLVSIIDIDVRKIFIENNSRFPVEFYKRKRLDVTKIDFISSSFLILSSAIICSSRSMSNLISFD